MDNSVKLLNVHRRRSLQLKRLNSGWLVVCFETMIDGDIALLNNKIHHCCFCLCVRW